MSAERYGSREFMADGHSSMEMLLHELLRYEEILGVIAVSVEGLVMGTAGVVGEDVDLAAALGASLVGVAERTTRRLGAGAATGLAIATTDGMVHLRNGGEFALILFTERCDTTLISDACDTAMREFADVLSPA
jgi:predicted regulator of Ras-like GTPase activity (Roadblock/LC7/MglB family)